VASFGEILDKYRAAQGAGSDSELARKLGKSPSWVNQMRFKGSATDDFCLEIASALQIEAGTVLIARNALKESGAVGEAWKRLLGKVAGILLLLGLNPVDLRADSSIAAGMCLSNATQVLDSPSKDYRNYWIRQLRQVVGRIFRAMFPVMHDPVHPLSNVL